MKKISKRDIIIIVVTILAGLIAHLYMYTNHIVNHDAVFAVNYSGSTYTSGRWLLGLMTNVAYLFNGNYVTPWGIGVVTLCLYAISAYLIIRAFNLKNIWICCCVGTIMITYPTVTSNNLYIFTAHYYAFAVMLVCLAIYLLSKYNYSVLSIIQASLLLVCSLAIYQGYLPFFVTANIVLLFHIFMNQKDLKILEAIKSIGKFLCTTIIGLAIYSILNKIILHIVGGQMDTYLGMNKMGSISIMQIPKIIYHAYGAFLGICLKDSWGINQPFWLKLIFLMCIVFIFGNCIKYIVCGTKEKKIIAILFCIVFPLAVNSIYIMCQEEKGINTMTVYATIWIFIVPLILIDKFEGVNKNTYLKKVAIIMAMITVVYYSGLANQTYVGLEYSNKNVEAYFIQLATQIKMIDGYSEQLPVAFIGKINDKSIPDIWYDYEIRGNFKTSDLINTYSREYFMKMSCGYNIKFIRNVKKIKETEKFKKMPVYPNKNGIDIVNNTIVVKFSE